MSSKILETRSRILDATWNLLKSDQGKGVRMADIAKEAGVSRQAVYLHFPARSDLLIATARYIDEANEIDGRLEASRSAATGAKRLDAFIEEWGNYIPVVYPVAKALLAMTGTDDAATAAVEDRDQAVRHGCSAAVQALGKDGDLSNALSAKEATDILWTLLSIRTWERFIGDCAWPQKRYVEATKSMARRVLMADGR
jgi:AcrR family transcriptional regulator